VAVVIIVVRSSATVNRSDVAPSRSGPGGTPIRQRPPKPAADGSAKAPHIQWSRSAGRQLGFRVICVVERLDFVRPALLPTGAGHTRLEFTQAV
jgi:hypothetical protein